MAIAGRNRSPRMPIARGMSANIRPAFAKRKPIESVPVETETWTPPERGSETPTTSDLLHIAPGAISSESEQRFIEVLLRPRDAGENHASTAANREHELRRAFDELDIVQAFHLKRRLESNGASDRLCVAFRRLTNDRRGRLLAFLGDTRRRKMIAR